MAIKNNRYKHIKEECVSIIEQYARICEREGDSSEEETIRKCIDWIKKQ